MDSSFFKQKRKWSRYKDFLLEQYLDPYIPKVATLERPILIVDAFAGRGRFADGTDGSPLIIAKTVEKWRLKGKNVAAKFIEADRDNYTELSSCVKPYNSFASASYGTFEDALPELRSMARHQTVFLYVDPYSVRGLHFTKMEAVFNEIRESSSSVEILLNFNVVIFMRWALAALKRFDELPADDDVETFADRLNDNVERATLSEIAGGDYWIKIASNADDTFAEKLAEMMAQYQKQMSRTFANVCNYSVKERYHHQIPKYSMVFATRSFDGVELMNDAMCKANRQFLEEEFPSKEHLFDVKPAKETVDVIALRKAVFELFSTESSTMNRKQIRRRLLHTGPVGRVTTSEINRQVGELLKHSKLFSATGKTRINDDVSLSKKPFVNE